jgi:hypothetical protein
MLATGSIHWVPSGSAVDFLSTYQKERSMELTDQDEEIIANKIEDLDPEGEYVIIDVEEKKLSMLVISSYMRR